MSKSRAPSDRAIEYDTRLAHLTLVPHGAKRFDTINGLVISIPTSHPSACALPTIVVKMSALLCMYRIC